MKWIPFCIFEVRWYTDEFPVSTNLLAILTEDTNISSQSTSSIPCIASCFKVQSPKSDIPTSKINKNYINPNRKSPQSIDEREKEGSPSFKRSHRELFKSIDLSHLAWFKQGLASPCNPIPKNCLYIYKWNEASRQMC